MCKRNSITQYSKKGQNSIHINIRIINDVISFYVSASQNSISSRQLCIGVYKYTSDDLYIKVLYRFYVSIRRSMQCQHEDVFC